MGEQTPPIGIPTREQTGKLQNSLFSSRISTNFSKDALQSESLGVKSKQMTTIVIGKSDYPCALSSESSRLNPGQVRSVVKAIMLSQPIVEVIPLRKQGPALIDAQNTDTKIKISQVCNFLLGNKHKTWVGKIGFSSAFPTSMTEVLSKKEEIREKVTEIRENLPIIQEEVKNLFKGIGQAAKPESIEQIFSDSRWQEDKIELRPVYSEGALALTVEMQPTPAVPVSQPLYLQRPGSPSSLLSSDFFSSTHSSKSS